MCKRALTKREVADLFRLAPKTVGDPRWQKRIGLLPIRIGRSLRFLECDVMRLIEKGRKHQEDSQR